MDEECLRSYGVDFVTEAFLVFLPALEPDSGHEGTATLEYRRFSNRPTADMTALEGGKDAENLSAAELQCSFLDKVRIEAEQVNSG